MRLYLTEKPSAARSLRDALGGGRYVKPSTSFIVGHIEGNGWMCTWLSGHFYRLSEPHEHDERYKIWRLSDLPMIIEDHYWKPIDYDTGRLKASEINEQIEHIKSLYPRVTEICIASDAGQEGQLLAQVFVQESGWKGDVTRLWTGSWNPEDVKKEIRNIKPNSLYQGYFDAAEARTISDAWIGFNFTRLFRLLAQQAGYNPKSSVGGVRSPALAMIVDSDLRHESHKASAYYEAKASFKYQDKDFNADLDIPSALLTDGKRCSDVQAFEAYLSGLSSVVSLPVLSKEMRHESRPPPAPFCHNTACQYMAQHFDMMPEQTDKCLQSLYDMGLMSYPRTEEEVYENGALESIGQVTQMLAGLDPELAKAVNSVNLDQSPEVFNSSLVEEHSALFVTNKAPEWDKLSEHEVNTYKSIAKRLLAQFASPLITSSTSIKIGNERYTFSIRGTTTESLGWAEFLPHEEKQDSLPPLQRGDMCDFLEIQVQEKKTKAPSRMTVVAFLAALRDCSKYLSSRVKEAIGQGSLGTAATQSKYKGALERSKDVSVQSGKYIVSTKQGRNLKALTPPVLSSPDMRSLWEIQFRAIRKGETTKSAFLSSLKEWLTNTVLESKQKRFKPSPVMNPCPRCSCALIRRSSAKTRTHFYVCSNEECGAMIDDMDGRPVVPLPEEGSICTNCGAAMTTRVRKKVLPKPGSKRNPAQNKDRRYLTCSARCKSTHTNKQEGANK